MQIFFSILWWIYFCIFFTGYPLMFAFLYFTGKSKSMHRIAEKMYPLLPLSYAFVATCFWILMLCTGRADFIFERIASAIPAMVVILYSLTSLLFWVPKFRKKTYLSLLHSLPFFLLPPSNMLLRITRHKIVAHDYIFNLLRIYTAAFILYILVIIVLLIVKWFAGTVIFRHHKA